jgi:hypothetical protein
MAVLATPWSSRSLDARLRRSRAKAWANCDRHRQRFGGWQLEAREVAPSGDHCAG